MSVLPGATGREFEGNFPTSYQENRKYTLLINATDYNKVAVCNQPNKLQTIKHDFNDY